MSWKIPGLSDGELSSGGRTALCVGALFALNAFIAQRLFVTEYLVYMGSIEVEAKLAVADRADGTEDQVITQCPGCGLAMEGSDDYLSQVADYSIHFCSDRCKNAFAEDPEGMLTALAVDGEAQAEGEPEAE